MFLIQQAASQVVAQVLAGRNLNQVLREVLQSMPEIVHQQRGALQDMSYGTLRHYGRLQRVLAQLLHKPVQDEALRCLLLVALYQLLHTKAAQHAVVDNAVRAVRRRNVAAGGLTNAVLRNFLRKKDALLAIADTSEEGRYSYPQWWIDALKAQYGKRAEAILLAGNLHPPMTLRVNNGRISPEGYLAMLAQQSIRASLIAPEAVLLEAPVAVDKLPGFADGLISVQDAGAQYAALLLDVQSGMRVLDACAAPGGKSTHLLELAQLELLALDKDEQRLQLVRENMQRLRLSAQLICGDAAQPQEWWDGQPFQRILADVPCSATGVVRRHPDIKWLRRPADIEGYAQQQSQILNALWQLLAKEGKLLYATCSVFARENQQVIADFLRQHEDAEQLPLNMPNLHEGQLLPDNQHDGFFYALIQRTVDRHQKTDDRGQRTEDRMLTAIQRTEDRRQRTEFCPLRGFFNFKSWRSYTTFCLLSSVLCLLTAVLFPLSSRAEGIEIRKAETHFFDNQFHFSADFDIRLKFVVEQALEQGVPLYFISEFTLTHPRWYWFEETVAQSEQTVKLSYNTLTRQYRIARGALFQNFVSLDDALRIVGHHSVAPIPPELFKESYIAEKIFKKDNDFVAAVRLRLDISQLPKPLQVNALTGDDWNLNSDWYRWVVRPDTVARNKGE